MASAERAPVDCEPEIAFAPLHAPEAEQVVESVADQVKVELEPFVTELGAALSATMGAREFTETVADWLALPAGPVQLSV